jgi:hypothetical protein
VYENSYTQVIVYGSSIEYGGNATLTNTTASTFGTQTFSFRNIIYGYRGFYLPLNNGAKMFYFNFLPLTNPQYVGFMEAVQQGIRSCSNGNFTIFRAEDGLCHD